MSVENNGNFREGEYCYKYPHPALTVDCVIFGLKGNDLQVLLIERGMEPHKGMWALPGGFMRMNETAEEAAARELKEETGLHDVYLDQFRVYSDVKRDPRERVVTVSFIAVVKPSDYKLAAGDDAASASWFNVNDLPKVAFDHERIIREAREHIKDLLKVKPFAFKLLNSTFSMGELQKVYEILNETSYDRRNFQRSVIEADILDEIPREEAAKIHVETFTRGRSGSKRYALRRVNTGKEKKDGSIKGLFDCFRF